MRAIPSFADITPSSSSAAKAGAMGAMGAGMKGEGGTEGVAGLHFGAGVTLSRMIEAFQGVSASPVYPAIVRHLMLVAHWQVRDQGSWAGNLMIEKRHLQFPSDVVATLSGAGAVLTVVYASDPTTSKTMSIPDFILGTTNTNITASGSDSDSDSDSGSGSGRGTMVQEGGAAAADDEPYVITSVFVPSGVVAKDEDVTSNSTSVRLSPMTLFDSFKVMIRHVRPKGKM